MECEEGVHHSVAAVMRFPFDLLGFPCEVERSARLALLCFALLTTCCAVLRCVPARPPFLRPATLEIQYEPNCVLP